MQGFVILGKPILVYLDCTGLLCLFLLLLIYFISWMITLLLAFFWALFSSWSTTNSIFPEECIFPELWWWCKMQYDSSSMNFEPCILFLGKKIQKVCYSHLSSTWTWELKLYIAEVSDQNFIADELVAGKKSSRVWRKRRRGNAVVHEPINDQVKGGLIDHSAHY